MTNGSPSLGVRAALHPISTAKATLGLTGLTRPGPAPAGVEGRRTQDTFEVRRAAPTGIWVNNTWHKSRTVADLLPGDVGFYYKKKGRDFKQRLISLGESFINLSQSGHKGDASVLHAYIVLQSFPVLNRVLVADAAGGPDNALGTAAIYLDFTGRDKDAFDVDSYHLYYRFKDPRLRERVVRRAQAWTQHEVANFALGHATSSPLRVKSLLPYGRRRVRHLLTHPPFATPVPNIGARPNGRNSYKVMCSEFVASVYIPEIIGLFCEDHGVSSPQDGLKMGGLKAGVGGSVFNCDPRYLVPSSLQGRLARSPQVERIGCVPPAFVTE